MVMTSTSVKVIWQEYFFVAEYMILLILLKYRRSSNFEDSVLRHLKVSVTVTSVSRSGK